MFNFKISDEVYQKCVKFSQESISTNVDKYRHRNQFNPAKIALDIRNGKIAEEMVYQELLPMIPGLTAPDHMIYEKRQKSWDPDLKDNNSNLRLAVKSVEMQSAQMFGESWVFQFGNGKIDCDKEIFVNSNPNQYVCLVFLNVAKREGKIRAIVAVDWLHEKKLFKPMQKKNLTNKLAVYYQDLEIFKNELFQLPQVSEMPCLF